MSLRDCRREEKSNWTHEPRTLSHTYLVIKHTAEDDGNVIRCAGVWSSTTILDKGINWALRGFREKSLGHK